MSRDNFDEEIASLYQQRKQHVVVPKVTFDNALFKEDAFKESKLNKTSSFQKYSLIKLFGLFTLASMTSFGIMAIINHFSALPKSTGTTNSVDHHIKLIALAPKLPEKIKVLPAKPLPPKPESNLPTTNKRLKPEVENTNKRVVPLVINTSFVSAISLPSLSKPKVVLEPTYKVMPKYSLKTNTMHKEGEIKLSYQIEVTGKIKNITIDSSTVSRDLQQSAKKALSQWQYNPNDLIDDVNHQVIFKFKKPEN